MASKMTKEEFEEKVGIPVPFLLAWLDMMIQDGIREIEADNWPDDYEVN